MIFAFMCETPKYDGIGIVLGGQYNGYVATDMPLPASYQSGARYDDEHALDNFVNVHGGITFDAPMHNDWPFIPLTEIPAPESFERFRVIGFDTMHYDDTPERWDFDAVRAETMRMYEQIGNLINAPIQWEQ